MEGAIRKAASLIAVRRAGEGPEVLVVERGAQSRFLPGYVAFPGGATDVGDADLATRWFGSSVEAPRACAVRELAEEVGLVLTAQGLRAGTRGTLDDPAASPPTVDQLPRIAHWVAPEDVPVRFDADYFAVAAEAGIEPEPDGGEVARAWWASPGRLLAEWAEGTRRLYWPTYFTLQHLAACARMEDLLALRIPTREADDHEVARLPRSIFWQDEG
ncbi:MAG TPA: NUDIX domain-containing protein [Actinomycetota bacterium]|jgi:8-oxo-dGTP pyrophosphatase MutT (NUDIX family)|nr:NUDIX domain-containing protein [Actinomycetota bacterium]